MAPLCFSFVLVDQQLKLQVHNFLENLAIATTKVKDESSFKSTARLQRALVSLDPFNKLLFLKVLL
jgi:hypothetical protein